MELAAPVRGARGGAADGGREQEQSLSGHPRDDGEDGRELEHGGDLAQPDRAAVDLHQPPATAEQESKRKRQLRDFARGEKERRERRERSCRDQRGHDGAREDLVRDTVDERAEGRGLAELASSPAVEHVREPRESQDADRDRRIPRCERKRDRERNARAAEEVRKPDDTLHEPARCRIRALKP